MSKKNKQFIHVGTYILLYTKLTKLKYVNEIKGPFFSLKHFFYYFNVFFLVWVIYMQPNSSPKHDHVKINKKSKKKQYSETNKGVAYSTNTVKQFNKPRNNNNVARGLSHISRAAYRSATTSGTTGALLLHMCVKQFYRLNRIQSHFMLLWQLFPDGLLQCRSKIISSVYLFTIFFAHGSFLFFCFVIVVLCVVIHSFKPASCVCGGVRWIIKRSIALWQW